MIIDLFDRLNFMQRLEVTIRRKYKPKNTDVEELTANLLDCYEYDLEECGKRYFKVQGNMYEDVLEYAKFCGGYKMFDFVLM